MTSMLWLKCKQMGSGGYWKNFDDDQLQLEAYERERRRKVTEHMQEQQAAQINISNEEQPITEPDTTKEH